MIELVALSENFYFLTWSSTGCLPFLGFVEIYWDPKKYTWKILGQILVLFQAALNTWIHWENLLLLLH